MIGIDIVKNDRIARLCSLYGYKFLIKFMTDKELLYLETLEDNSKLPYVIKCWAAKEACIKAVRCSTFLDFSLLKNGCLPYITTDKPFAIEISLADEHEYTVAVAMAHRVRK